MFAALLLAGCDAVQGGESIELDSGTLDIAGSVHDVRLTGTGGIDSIAPAVVEAEPGDAIRFVVGDGRPHALAFVADSLTVAVRDYLDRTGQLRGPPLVSQGAAWIVVLDSAPPGRYPFYCRSHDAHGVVTVAVDD